jgi:2-oxoisovalerate dehydrogenase E1 component
LQVAAAAGHASRLRLVCPYYRDRALCLALGVTAEEMFLQAVGAAGRPGQRRTADALPLGQPQLNIVSTSSSTATQVLHAVGCAEAGRYYARKFPKRQPGKSTDDYRAFHDVASRR